MSSAETTQRHYDGIDLLRIGAALAVVFFHYAFRGAAAGGYTTFHVPSLIPVAQYCYLGVELFFIISGFIIVMSAEGRSAGAFARSRFLRIYPAFVVAMTITAALAAVIGQPPFSVSATGWLANLTLFPTLLGKPFVDGVYWTLELEVVFYCWVTLLIRLGWFQRHRPVIIAAWLALSLVVNMFTASKPLHALLLTEAAPFFAGGMLIYDIRRFGLTIQRAALWSCAVAMSVASVWAGAAYERIVLHASLDDRVLAGIVLALYGVFIAGLALPRLPRLSRWLGLAGAASYPLYLLHQHIGFMLFNRLGNAFSTPVTALIVLGIIGAGTIVFMVWIEPAARRTASHLLDLATLPGRRQGARRATLRLRIQRASGETRAIA